MYPWWWMDQPSKARLTYSGFSSSMYSLILALPLSYIYKIMQGKGRSPVPKCLFFIKFIKGGGGSNLFIKTLAQIWYVMI